MGSECESYYTQRLYTEVIPPKMNTIVQALGPSDDPSESEEGGAGECIRWHQSQGLELDRTFELIWIDKFNAAFLKFTQIQKERENEFID